VTKVNPINLSSDGHGLENADATDILCTLRCVLWDEFNTFVEKTNGVVTAETRLLASHTLNGQTVPSIWISNVPDNLPINKDGIAIVISPAPRTVLNSYAERVNRWSLYCIDYSPNGLKLNALLQIIQGRLFTHSKFVPIQADEDMYEPRGYLYLDLPDDLRSRRS
jgi:hypothetical protein